MSNRQSDFPEGKKYYSVSQYKQMKDCGYQFWLQRREKAWQRPAAWFPQGTAVHYAAEVWERSGRTMALTDAEDAFRDSYVESVAEYTVHTPNLGYWTRSGPYDGEVDVTRRFGLGLAQVERYIDYYTEKAPREVIWITPDGTPAIELPFDIELDGVRVVGYIDQITEVQDEVAKPRTPSGALAKSKKALDEYAAALEASPFRPRPRDIKSGNKPGDAFQLGVYDVAVDVLYGIKADIGDYWMGRQGKPTAGYDLEPWSREAVTEEFHWLDEAVREERFDPKPEPDKCLFCTVRSSCSFSAV